MPSNGLHTLYQDKGSDVLIGTTWNPVFKSDTRIGIGGVDENISRLQQDVNDTLTNVVNNILDTLKVQHSI